MSENQAPYRTSTSAEKIAQAAHTSRERLLHVQGALEQLLTTVRTGEVDTRAAQERCRRLSTELRAAADELENVSAN